MALLRCLIPNTRCQETEGWAQVRGLKGLLHVDALAGLVQAQLVEAHGLALDLGLEVVDGLVLHIGSSGSGFEDHVEDPVLSCAR